MKVQVYDFDTGKALSGIMVTLSQYLKSDINRTTDAAGVADLGVVVLTGMIDTLWIFSSTYENVKESLNSTADRTYRLRGYSAPITSPLPPPPVFPQKPGEPLPLGPKEEIRGTVGTSCDLINNYSFARSVYYGRNRYTGQLTEQSMDYETARGKAERSSVCQQQPPPTAKDWQDGIQKQVTSGFDALSKYFTDGLKSVTESWQNGIFDLEARITGVLSKEISDRVKALLDLDARIKAWISESIFELLLKNLNASAIEYKKSRGKT